MNYIIITSIFPPTEVVKHFSKMKNYRLIVVGDNKTPSDWHLEETEFLSTEKQKSIGKHLNSMLPFNHYCRKMMGYVYAIKNGAELIYDTDDDNVPKSNWGFPEFNGIFQTVSRNRGFINIYKYFTSQKIWPRGLPLNCININFNYTENIVKRACNVGVWQGLADDDPDVDAIYRLTNYTPCKFESKEPIVLSEGTISPFNSQNTLIRKELFPLLYLPTSVTFRFTDILRGLVAQPIMWLYGYHLGFTEATVIQKRNPHDYFKDFLSEIPMYQYTEKVIELTNKVIKKDDSISNNLFSAYEELYKNEIVIKKELDVLSAWLKEI